MEYFYNPKNKKTVAHIWMGSDTACTMFSTGGLRGKKRLVMPDTSNKPICLMCQNNALKLQSKSGFGQKRMTTVVNITLVQEGDQITIRSDAVGRDEQVLALGLQILGHLSYLEMQHPEIYTVDMPTLSAGKH